MRTLLLFAAALAAAACGGHHAAHPGETREVVYAVSGMHCDGCAETIRAALAGCAGVEAAQVDFASGEARVRVTADCDLDALPRAAGEGFGFTRRE